MPACNIMTIITAVFYFSKNEHTLDVTLVPDTLADCSLLLSAGSVIGLASAVGSRPQRERLARLEPMESSDTDGAFSEPPRLPFLCLCCFFLEI